MISWLKLRYTIYNSTRCAGFLSENEMEIDIDAYDLQSKHYGLFVEEADQQKLIGGLRVIQNRPVLSSIRLLKELNLLPYSEDKPDEVLPILSYFPEDKETHFSPLLANNPLATEGSRLVLNKEYQSLRLAKFIISSALTFHLRAEEDWVLFVSCNPLHARLYKSFGFEPVCEHKTWAKDAPVSALYLLDHKLDQAKRLELEAMLCEFDRYGYMRYEHVRKTAGAPIRRKTAPAPLRRTA
ncbi:MAG: hypothetical protein AAFZ63_06545 [Bacteroidota bacterium]